jgi:acetyl esterase
MLRSRHPDPEVRRLLLQMAAAPSPSISRTGVGAARRRWQLAVKAFASREPVEAVVERTIPGPAGPTPIRAYVPAGGGDRLPVLAWFHGGGFVVGDLFTAGATCRALANRSGAVVVAVQYRLAPEHPLDAGRADCHAAVEWLAANAAELGGDPARLAVGGDSAGGGLAALVAQAAPRLGLSLAAQVLAYPATDLTGSHPSYSERMPGLLTPKWTAWLRAQIALTSDLSDPAASPLRAPDLRGVAPAVVLTAGFDPLRDEGLAYVSRLREAGVPVRALHYPGQIHGFVSLDRVLTAAGDALTRLGTHLSDAFAGALEPGTDPELPPDRNIDRLLWAKPAQRWHELKVTALVACSLIQSKRPRPTLPLCEGERR